MITGSLQIKKNIYYAVINYYDSNNKRKQKWISTKIKSSGSNKKLANRELNNIILDFESKLNSQIKDKIDTKLDKKTIDNETSKIKCNMLFADYMLEWLEIIKNSIELTSYAGYSQVIKGKMNTYFRNKGILLKELTALDIEQFYQYLFSLGLKGVTVKHYHANINKALDYAIKKDIITVNPMQKVDVPKMEMHISEYYTKEEIEKLFEAFKTSDKFKKIKLPVMFAVYFGLRRSEIIGLKWEAINFNENTVTIKHTVSQVSINGEYKIVTKDRTKNKSSYRTLPLIEDMKFLLLELKKKQEENKKIFKKGYITKYIDYIFVDDIGDLIKPEYVTQTFKKMLKAHNLKRVKFHALRHSCASLLLANNVNMKEIQEWLGHSTYTTTANIYAHLSVDSKNNSADVLSKTLSFEDKNKISPTAKSNDIL